MTNPNPEQDFLMGGGTPSLTFNPNKGYVMGQTIHRGKVVSRKVQQQRDIDNGEPKYWKNGDPMMQLQVVLETNYRDPTDSGDDGRRALYVSSPGMKNAIRDAVKAAGAKDLEPGGELAICWIENGEQPANKAYNPPKIYKAQYKAPDAGSADFLGTAAGATPADPWAGGSQAPVQTQVPQGVHPAQHFANVANQAQPLAQAAQQATSSAPAAADLFAAAQPVATAPANANHATGIARPDTIDPAFWATLNATQQQALANMAGMAAPAGQPTQSGYTVEPPF